MKKKGILKVAIVAALVLLVVISSMVMSHPWRYVSIKRDADVSKEVFLQQMEKLDEHYNTSNFSEIADQLFSEAQERGYDVYLAPAIMCLETRGGTTATAQYNYWNHFPYNEMAFIVLNLEISNNFLTPEESVEWFFNELDKKYGDISYKEFMRFWTPNYPLSKAPSKTADAYAETLYKTVKWIKNL